MTAKTHATRKPLLVGVAADRKVAGVRARSLAQPVPEGKVRCRTCGQAVSLRADGTLRGHQSRGQQSGVACAGAPGRYQHQHAQFCEHGNYPNERKKTCGCPARLPLTKEV